MESDDTYERDAERDALQSIYYDQVTLAPNGYEIRIDIMGSSIWASFELPSGYPQTDAVRVSLSTEPRFTDLSSSNPIKNSKFTVPSLISSSLGYFEEQLNSKAQAYIGQVSIFDLTEELNESLRLVSEDVKLGDFGALSTELICRIFSHLHWSGLGRLATACSSLKSISDSDLLWKPHCAEFVSSKAVHLPPAVVPSSNFKAFIAEHMVSIEARGGWLTHIISVRERIGTGDEFDPNRPWEEQLRNEFNTTEPPSPYSMRGHTLRSGQFFYTSPGMEPEPIGRYRFLTDADMEPLKHVDYFTKDTEKHPLECPFLGKRLGWLTFELKSSETDVFERLARLCRGCHVHARSASGSFLLRHAGVQLVDEYQFVLSASLNHQKTLGSYRIKWGETDTYRSLQFLASPLTKTRYGLKLRTHIEKRLYSGSGVVIIQYWGVRTDNAFPDIKAEPSLFNPPRLRVNAPRKDDDDGEQDEESDAESSSSSSEQQYDSDGYPIWPLPETDSDVDTF